MTNEADKYLAGLFDQPSGTLEGRRFYIYCTEDEDLADFGGPECTKDAHLWEIQNPEVIGIEDEDVVYRCVHCSQLVDLFTGCATLDHRFHYLAIPMI